MPEVMPTNTPEINRFGMEDSMSQEVDLCDNCAVAPENLNKLAQTQSCLVSETETGGQQVSITKAPSRNNGSNELDEQDEHVCKGQIEDDQDEVMREEEDYSEETSLIRCQSPDTPMTDSSFSETGSLHETACGFSPGTSPEPSSPIPPMEGSETLSQSGTLDSCYCDTKTELYSANSSGSEQYTSSQETVLIHKRPPANRPSAVSFEEKERQSQNCVSFTAPAGIETSNEFTCTQELNQEPSQLLEFLDQLAKRGDDTHLPLYLHQTAEAFVSQEDYQRAIWCIQLERLYHQRLLDNLGALQRQWESRCNNTSPALTAQHLDTLKHICLTHSRPKASDAVCASLDPMVVPSCSLARGRMEKDKGEDSSDTFLLSPSIDQDNQIDASEVTEGEWEDLKSERSDCLQLAPSNVKEGSEPKADESEGGLASTMYAEGDWVPPSVTDKMDQSKTAEQQGGGLHPTQDQDTDAQEERDVEEATEALHMEDEDEAEEEEHDGKAFKFLPKTLPVETVVSAAAVEIRQLESKSEQKETQLSPEDIQSIGKICVPSEIHAPGEFMYPTSLDNVGKEEEEEEEEEDYEIEPADLIRAAATLDTLAKLITVEEVVPVPGLVSILKKRTVCNESPEPASPEPRSDNQTGKRRVRFKVPDDGFDSDMGGGDSCLLLFLLCLVTVVISIGGTALYCALGDTHSSVCQDFSRNADFYIGQIQWGISQIQLWFTPTS